MSAHEGNKDAADELRKLGVEALRSGNLEAAMRRLSKSQRLYPSPETEALIARAEDARPRDEPGPAEGSSSGPPRSPTGDVTGGESTSATGLHRRHADRAFAPEAAADADATLVTEEQVMLVQRVIKSSRSYYEVLEVSRSCTVEDVKKAYRKLSLKVHPDKNKAPGAEEAFKVVSKAFKCLSDPRLRANYDQYGHEDPNQRRLEEQMERRRQASHMHQGNPYAEEFDPNDIFNAFFGMNARVHVNRAYHQQRRARRRQQDGDGNIAIAFGLLQFLPFFIFLVYLFTPSPDPPYKNTASPPYTIELRTNRWKVPYYIKSREDFSSRFPPGSHARWRIDQTVEGEYKERLVNFCYQEKLSRAQAYRWGNQAQAKKMSLPNCEELQRLLDSGLTSSH